MTNYKIASYLRCGCADYDVQLHSSVRWAQHGINNILYIHEQKDWDWNWSGDAAKAMLETEIRAHVSKYGTNVWPLTHRFIDTNGKVRQLCKHVMAKEPLVIDS